MTRKMNLEDIGITVERNLCAVDQLPTLTLQLQNSLTETLGPLKCKRQCKLAPSSQPRGSKSTSSIFFSAANRYA